MDLPVHEERESGMRTRRAGEVAWGEAARKRRSGIRAELSRLPGGWLFGLLVALSIGISGFAGGAPATRGAGFDAADVAEEAFELNERAVEAISKGETERAAELLERAHELSPSSEVIRNNLAEARFRLGADACDKERYADAVPALLASIRLRGDRSKPWVFLGVARYRLFDHAGAIVAFERAIELDDKDSSAFENLGHVLYATSRPRKAVDAWKKALRLGSPTEDLPDQVRRVEREIEVESRFATSRTTHFDIRHDPGIRREALEVVHGAVERAWVRVGQALDTYPDETVPVVVYTRAGFSKVTKGHRWVAGLFDGRIRIPVDQDADADALVDTIAH